MKPLTHLGHSEEKKKERNMTYAELRWYKNITEGGEGGRRGRRKRKMHV